MPALTSEQLKAQVTRWRGRRGWEEERVFAIRADFPYEGDLEIDCDGLRVKVANCQSDLEARDIMLGLSGKDDHGLLLLLRADEQCIGEDVRAGFAGKMVHTFDQREVLKEIYQAASIDPRISNDAALLDAMVIAGSVGSDRKAPGGVLDLDFAWSVILRQPELMNHRPDLVEILRWSLDKTRWPMVKALNEALVPSFFQWVGERAGGVSRCLEALFTTDETGLYIPLGLVAGDLFHKRLEGKEGAADARVRIENYLNGESLKPTEAAIWSAAAHEVLAKLELDERERIAGHVDTILEGIRATGFASAFSYSKQGFKDRWLKFADDIDRLGKRKWASGSRAIFSSLSQLREHGLAPLNEHRLKRAEMAVRLTGYEARFSERKDKATGLSSLAKKFSTCDSFIDWARFSLSWGDPISEVAEAYGRLGKRIAKARIKSQIAFGEQLCHWHAGNELGGKELIPIESMVTECVAPLAAEQSVLLLVMDGMSFPAFHQLGRSLERSGWAAQREQGGEFPSRVLSVLPSVTEISRWALFSGEVKHEQRNTEVVAFRNHDALTNLPGRGKPILFTKGELGAEDSAALSTKVRDALAGSHHRVVAVVINAIDDQLKTGGQLSLDWSVNDIGILPTILEAAAEGNRLIVMTSDHGHTPEMENTKPIETSSEGETRYRYGQVSDEDEREFSGKRIEAATGQKSVILPVTETLRYGRKAAGYHGGACDLEAIVPLAVFASPGDEVKGYEAVDSPKPEWWDWNKAFRGDESNAAPLPIQATKPKAKKKVASVDDLPLFEGLSTGLSGSAGEAAWLDAFFQSEVFAEQQALLRRAAPNKDHLRKVLITLDANGDTLLMDALALAIGQPSFRIQGMLSSIARFMNVDGYEVLEIDRDSETVRLHRKLLVAQFQLKI